MRFLCAWVAAWAGSEPCARTKGGDVKSPLLRIEHFDLAEGVGQVAM